KVNSIIQKTQGSAVRRLSLAEELGLSRPGGTAADFSKPTETHFQSKVAAELWLNIGGKDFRLVGKTIRIGRSEDNDIVLDHKSCSRYHAILTLHKDQIILEDLKSRNGIKVNGTPVKRAELKDNDEVQVGDLPGVFFQRSKSNPRSSYLKIPLLPESIRRMLERAMTSKAVESFNELDSKRKKIVVGAAILLLVGFFMMLPKGRAIRLPSIDSRTSSLAAELKPSDRKSFERCLEAEDLGNFRQATACFRNLAQTADVQVALQRIQKRQSDMSERRYKEGEQAFANYYYDIAMEKWQEVLLVSDDSSEFRLQAMRGLKDAEEKMKQR
ncbi:MAG: EmbR protein, partial [Bacteriovoracaceae bacterium]|nr:EmbR protein [Bacteriovoracaceae bacterium]